jgi:DNA helicase-2/ATP-dependent DNA helicase PcrA
MSEILRGLNLYQREAVTHFEGPLLILAGFGSGKTRVITHRIAYLIKEYGVPPDNILGVTFTNKAAEEMKRRVEKLLSSNAIPQIKTFHSACAQILRSHISHIPPYNENFSILDEDDQRQLIAGCMKELDIPEQFSPQVIATMISRAKDNLISDEDFPQKVGGDGVEVVSIIYKRYQQKLKQTNALDFGDLIRLTVQLFWDNLEVLNYYRDMFRFILIDEYQDTNFSQYILSRLLAEKYENICVVGDDDQAIFSWRGADPSNIFRFERDFPKAKVVKLKRSYRSTKRILRAARALIKNNPLRKEKSLQAVREEGELICLHQAASERDEAIFVAEEIKRLKSKGVNLNEIAVLYRVNTLSRLIEETLIRYQIPYEMVRGTRFYERMEVKDLLAYLRLILNLKDDISLRRILNKPSRGIGEKTQEAIEALAKKRGISWWEALQEKEIKTSAVAKFISTIEDIQKKEKEVEVGELGEYVLQRTGYLKYLREFDEERVGNVEELIGQMRESVDLGDFLEKVALVSDVDSYTGKRGVALLTLHSAKGLEFDYVFIIGMEEGLLPHSRSVREGSIDEERRLCYVGLTRAKEKVYLTCANQRSLYGGVSFNAPSRFIKEIPPQEIEVKGG